MTDHEIDHLAKQFKPVVVPDLVPVAEKDGKPVGFRPGPARPQRHLPHQPAGPAAPGGILRLLWALKTRKIRRLPHPPPRRAAGVPRQGLDAMLYHWIWTKAGRARHLLGRGRLDPRRQSGHERRARSRWASPSTRPTGCTTVRCEGLVTGGTGFVGSHLVECSCAAAMRSPPWSAPRPRPPASPSAASGSSGATLTISDALREAAAGAGGHLPRGRASWPRGTRRSSSGSTATAPPTSWPPRAARRPPLRAGVHASPPRARPPGRPARGGEPPRPVTAYGRSKLAGEEVGARRPACPGPSSGRRWSTGRATRSAQGLQDGAAGAWPRSSATGGQELSAGLRTRPGRGAGRRGHQRRRRGKTYLSLPPGGFTSGGLVAPVGRAMGRRVRSWSRCRESRPRPAGAIGGAATLAGRPAAHRGQGQRVLPGGLDLRPGAADRRYRLARRARPRQGAGGDHGVVSARRMALMRTTATRVAPRRTSRSSPRWRSSARRSSPGCWWLLGGPRAGGGPDPPA